MNTIEDFFIGQMARLQRKFTDEDVDKCKELTKDYSAVYNPDHDVWKSNYHQPIVPGLLAEGLINQVIYERLPGRASILLQKELVFYHPVFVGDSITAELEIMDINMDRNWISLKVTCFNQDLKEVIKGQVVICLLNSNGLGD